jgi:hypothetical protein
MPLPLKLRLQCLGFLATAAFAFATAPVETARSAAPVEHTTEQKALLKALDDQLARFEALLAKDENASHAATVKAVLETLKQRGDAFNRVAFDQGKYDELRFDLNVAYQRLNLWLAPPIAPKAAPKTKAGE